MKGLKRALKWITGAILIVLLLACIVVFIAYWRSTNDCNRYSAAPANPMKAIVYCDYGVANLKLREIEKPVPNDDQILVRVRAASINPYDWHFVEGTPYVMIRVDRAIFSKPALSLHFFIFGFAHRAV